jgi:hypothetical protein
MLLLIGAEKLSTGLEEVWAGVEARTCWLKDGGTMLVAEDTRAGTEGIIDNG